MLKAAQRVHDERIGIPILLGRKEVILELKEEIGFTADVPIIDPKTEKKKNEEIVLEKYIGKHETKRNYIIRSTKINARA